MRCTSELNPRNMKTKCRILLTIKDHHEFKVLLNDFVISALSKKYKIDVAIFDIDDDMAVQLEINYRGIRFISDWPPKASFFSRVKYWVSLQVHFLSNMYRSESCFQKSVINFFSIFRFLFGIKDGGLMMSRFFLNNSVCCLAWQFLLNPLHLVSRVISWSLCRKKKNAFLSDSYEKQIYQYIVFGGPNSLANKYFYKKFIAPGSNAKVVTVCKNLETPSLKGIFVVPSDITISFDPIVTGSLRKLGCPGRYGKIVEFRNPLLNYKKPNVKKNRKKVYILFATSHQGLCPNDPQSVFTLHGFLHDWFDDNYHLTIRPVHSDDMIRYANVLSSNNVCLDDSLIVDKKRVNGLSAYNSKVEIEKFYDRLQSYDYVFSSSSTINYEAYLMGVKSAYISFDTGLSWVNRRDHLEELRNKYNIPLIKNVGELGEFFILNDQN